MAGRNSKKSFTSSFIAGSMSGACSTLLFQPLDLVKTRQQVPHTISETRHAVGAIRVIGDVVRNESVLGLWKGLTPSLIRTVPGVGLYFALLHGIQQTVYSPGTIPSPTSAALIAASARGITCATLLPFTVVKTRFESGEFHYRNVFHALRSMRKREGFRGLYSGMLATQLRDVPSSSLYYMFYTASKTYAHDHFPDSDHARCINLFCAIDSAFLACLMTHPVDVVKTRRQIGKGSKRSTFRMARRMLRDEGLLIFFSGARTRITRRSCVIAMSWTVYENVIGFLTKFV